MASIKQLGTYEWSPVQKCKSSTDTFRIGRKQKIEKLYMKDIQQIQIDENQLNQKTKKLIKLSQAADNIVKVINVLKTSQFKSDKKQDFKGPVKVICQYFASTPLSKLIAQRQQINKQQFVSLVMQIVSVMFQAQKMKIYHQNMHPDNILVGLTNNDIDKASTNLIKLTEWDLFKYQNKHPKKYLSFMKNYKMHDYLHPQIIFNQYKQYESRYDIWSFGVIIYELLQYRHPFSGKKSKSMQVQKLKQFYQKKQNLQLQDQTISYKIISKMLSLSSQKRFNSWEQLRNYMIIHLELTPYDFKPIKMIYQDHRRVLTYIIQMYKMTTWNLKYSPNNFWYEFKKQIIIFCKDLVQFVCIVNQKFTTRYKMKFCMFQLIQREQVKIFSKMIQNEWMNIRQVFNKVYGNQKKIQNHKKSQSQSKSTEQEMQKNFFIHFQDFILVIIKIKLVIDQSKKIKSTILKSNKVKIWNSIQLLSQFCSQLIKIQSLIEKSNKNILPVIYESQLFKNGSQVFRNSSNTIQQSQ